jgi:hypothetical protein
MAKTHALTNSYSDGRRALAILFARSFVSSGTSANPDSIRETEDYAVELAEVAVLELILNPDKRNDQARASLRRFRLA